MTTKITNIKNWENLIELAKNGTIDAQYEVASYFENGLVLDGIEIVKLDEKQAFYWMKIAYENGNIKALVRYADYLSEGVLCEKNIDLAIKIYKKGIELGSSEASFNLGIEYRNKQDFDKAFKFYNKSQTQNKSYYELTLAMCYYYGIGTKKDKLNALKHFENIKIPDNTSNEVDEANYMIGKIYLDGVVVKKSIEKARYYLELADKDEDHHSAKEILFIIGRTECLNKK